jgi:hypothetical protein
VYLFNFGARKLPLYDYEDEIRHPEGATAPPERPQEAQRRPRRPLLLLILVLTTLAALYALSESF